MRGGADPDDRGAYGFVRAGPQDRPGVRAVGDRDFPISIDAFPLWGDGDPAARDERHCVTIQERAVGAPYCPEVCEDRMDRRGLPKGAMRAHGVIGALGKAQA